MAHDLARSRVLVIRPLRSIWRPSPWPGTTHVRDGRLLRPEWLLAAKWKYSTAPTRLSQQYVGEAGLTGGHTDHRYCRCRRHGRAGLSLCVGDPEPNGERVCRCGADW